MTRPRLDSEGVDTAAYASLPTRVKHALEERLVVGETIRVILCGAGGQAMVGTDRRVFVCKPGAEADVAAGAEITAWEYTDLVRVRLQKRFLSDAVVLQPRRRTRQRTSYWGEAGDDPFTAANAIPISGDPDHVRAGVVFLSQLITLPRAPTPSAGTVPAVADRLRKLAALRDRGILTEHEFLAAKARILSNR